MATGKVIGKIEVASIGDVKIVGVDGIIRDAAYDGLMYEGEQLVSNNPETLFQIKYLALPEATVYEGVFGVLADGSVIANVSELETLFGDDIDFMETAAGGGEPGPDSGIPEDAGIYANSSVQGYSRGGNPGVPGLDGVGTKGAEAVNSRLVVKDVFLAQNEMRGDLTYDDDGFNTIPGQLIAIGPKQGATYTFSMVAGTLSVTDTNGVITMIEDDITVVFNPDGSYTISGNFNDLAVGEVATVSFDYTATDNGGLTSDPATVSFTVTGTNDIPVVEAINVNVNEYEVTQIHTITQEEGHTIGYSSFTVSGPTQITITTDGPTIDPNMYLLRNDGEVTVDDIIEYNDDGHTPAGAWNNSIISITLEPGDYIVAVSDYRLSEDELVNNYNDLGDLGVMTGDVTLTFTTNYPIMLEGTINSSSQIVETNSITGIGEDGETLYYETHDADDVIGEVDTHEELDNFFTGTLSVADDDVTDTHTYEVVNGTVAINGELVDDGLVNITYNENSENWEYIIKGDFNYLDIGEVATVTFDYVAIDDSEVGADGDLLNEPDTSEPATITVAITGTNDQPIIEDITTAVSEESLVDVDRHGGEVVLEDARYEGSVVDEAIVGLIDDDNNDGGLNTHTYAIDEGSLTLSITTTNQAFLDLFSITDLETAEAAVDAIFGGGVVDFNFLNVDGDADIADSVTIGTAQTFTIPQWFIEILQDHGLLIIDMQGNGDYSVESPLFNLLGAHDSVTIGFDYRATDNAGVTGVDGINELSQSEAATVTLTIQGTNDRPVAYMEDYISNESDLVDTTLGGVNTTFSAYLPGSDTGSILGDIFTRVGMGMEEDLFDAATLTFHLEPGTVSTEPRGESLTDTFNLMNTFGSTTVDVDESGEFTVSNAAFDNLGVGETATVTFQYYVDDQSGATGIPHESTRSEPVTVTVTITGTNDQPVLVSVTTDNELMETELTGLPEPFPYGPGYGESPEHSYITGWLTPDISDDDVNDTHEFVEFGQFLPPQNQPWVYATVVDVDNHGVLDGSSTPVRLFSSGEYRIYNSAFNNLGVGESVTVSFDVQVTDGTNDPNGEPAVSNTKTVILTISGTNDQPVVTDRSFVTSEAPGDGQTAVIGTFFGLDEDVNDDLSYDVLSMDRNELVTDIAGDDFVRIEDVPYDSDGNGAYESKVDIAVKLSSGTEVDLNDIDITGISVTGSGFTLSGDFNALPAGEPMVVKFLYNADDNSGADVTNGYDETSISDTKMVTITVNGTNDIADIYGDDSGEVVEDTTLIVNGNLDITDLDAGQAEFNTVFTPHTSNTTSYGTFTVDSTGAWIYDLDNTAAQELGHEDVVTERYLVHSEDGTDTQAVTITIKGTNEAPVANVDYGTTNVTTYTTNWEHDLNAGNDYDNGNVDIEVINGYSVDRSGPTMGVDGLLPNDSSQQLDPGEGIRFVFDEPVKLAELHLGNFNDGQDQATWVIKYDDGTTITTINSDTTDNNSGDVLVLAGTTSQYFNIIEITNTDNDRSFSIDQVLASDSGTNTLVADSLLYFPESEIIANDTDADGGTLDVISIDNTATLGIATLDSDGNVLYDPNGAFDTLAEGATATDSITYTISDGQGGESTSTINITIEGASSSSYNGESLVITGSTIDLSNISDMVDDIGEIDLQYSDQALINITPDIVHSLSDDTNVLHIDGDSGDSVTLDSNDWTYSDSGSGYDTYTGSFNSNDLILNIDTDIIVDI